MAHIVPNDVLCYLASARNNIPKDDITKSAVTFHNDNAIIRANDELFKLCNEKNIARKSSPSHPNVNVKHDEDILDLFSKKDDNPSRLPTFAAKRFASKQPSGFDIIALVVMESRDGITSLKAEVSEHRTTTQRDVRSVKHVLTIKHDVMILRSSFMNFAIVKRTILSRLLKSCLDLYRAVKMSPSTFQKGLSQDNDLTMEARYITCLRVKPLRNLYLRLPTC